jgi:hypothetical protein
LHQKLTVQHIEAGLSARVTRLFNSTCCSLGEVLERKQKDKKSMLLLADKGLFVNSIMIWFVQTLFERYSKAHKTEL